MTFRRIDITLKAHCYKALSSGEHSYLTRRPLKVILTFLRPRLALAVTTFNKLCNRPYCHFD
jgi:hypothetical protein